MLLSSWTAHLCSAVGCRSIGYILRCVVPCVRSIAVHGAVDYCGQLSIACSITIVLSTSYRAAISLPFTRDSDPAQSVAGRIDGLHA